MTETIGTANVTLIRENEDGSADYQFNFPPEALEALTRLGILTAIQAGIEDAKRLNPEETDDYKRGYADAMNWKVQNHLEHLPPAQREWGGLTDEEIKKEVEIEMEYYWDGDYIDTTCARDQLNGFARTIEAKLKEKND